MVKLATGNRNTKLCDLFGEPNHQKISNVHCFTILLLDSKAEGILHGETSLEQWVHHFEYFSGMIEHKLAAEAVSELLFENFCFVGFVDCKIDETCRPGSGPAEDRPLAPQHDDADTLQKSVYSGYKKSHGLKVLSVTFPNGSIGCLYGSISAPENDDGVLNLSNLNRDMIRLQLRVTATRHCGKVMLYYSIYGDAIFSLLLCITARNGRPIRGDLNKREDAENNDMKRV
jgi:hypothetical protein